MVYTGESWVRGAWWKKKFIGRSSGQQAAARTPGRPQNSPPPSLVTVDDERNPGGGGARSATPSPERPRAGSSGDVFIAPSTPTHGTPAPTHGTPAPVLQTPINSLVYNPAIRGSPGGAGRRPAVPTSIPMGLLWPEAPQQRLLKQHAVNAWVCARQQQGLETSDADLAAARARHNHFCIQDGRDDQRNAGGFDPESYEANDRSRKHHCSLAYDDLRRAAIALDRMTDSQTWVISYRPEANPSNLEAVSLDDPTVQRVRDPLVLSIPLFHVPPALQHGGATLPEWGTEVADLKNHFRRTFMVPHIETFAEQRQLAGMRGTLSGVQHPQAPAQPTQARSHARVPKRIARLSLSSAEGEQVLLVLANLPANMTAADALVALDLVVQLSQLEALALVRARLRDAQDGLA